MRWEVVVDEELTAHEEEREIMIRPSDGEEASVIPKPVANSCVMNMLRLGRNEKEKLYLTHAQE
jgi:hypothetical protein